MDKKTLDTIWKNTYGETKEAKDPYGNLVTYDDFVVDYIWPKSLKGSEVFCNLLAISKESLKIKDNKLDGKINGKTFKVDPKRIADDQKIVGRLFVDGEKFVKFSKLGVCSIKNRENCSK